MQKLALLALIAIFCWHIASGTDIDQAEKLIEKAKKERFSNPEHALELVKTADSLAKASHQTELLFEAGVVIADIAIHNGKLDMASKYLRRNAALLDKIKDKKNIARYYREQGLLNIKLGEYAGAEALIRKADSLFDNIGDSALMAACRCDLGIINESTGDYNLGLHFFMDALSIYTALNDSSGQANAIMNIGNIYYYTESYGKALDSYRQAARMDSLLRQYKSMAAAYNNIGGIYYNMGKTDAALLMLKRVIQLQQLDNDYSAMVESMINLSLIHGVNENYDSAFATLDRAIILSRKRHLNSLLCQSLLSKADLYLNMSSFELAAGNYLTAAQMADHFHLKDELKSAYEGLSSSYEKLGAYDKAHEYDKLLIHIKDSIYNVEKAAQLAEMQTKYEVGQKDKEIEINKLKLTKQQLALNKSRMLRIALSVGILLLMVIVFIIFRRYHEKRKANRKLARQNLMIEQQRMQLEEKNQNVTDSINYGKRLQQTMLPEEQELAKSFKDQFIFFRPRDIVSGDFYWFYGIDDTTFVAVADCTGHGVPGALVSVMGSNLLNQLVIEKAMRDPGEILTELNVQVAKVFKKEGAAQHASDGMDIAFFGLERDKMKLRYSGAYRPLLLIRNGKLTELPPDHRPIGGRTAPGFRFATKETDVLPGDVFYAFSDGYADQFGGEKGKKFLVRRFKEMLIDISDKPMAEQLKLIEKSFKEWQGSEEQVDDILVLGLKV